MQLSIKRQVLANFFIEWQEYDKETQVLEAPWWILYLDKALRVVGSGVELFLQSPIGDQVEQAV